MTLRFLIAFVLLCSAAVADPPPSSVLDEGGYLAKANAAVAAYQSIREWGGTFLVKETQPDKNGKLREINTYRVHMEVMEPKWRMELSILGQKGEVVSSTTEVFDGARNWVYLIQPDEKVASIYTHVDAPQGSWVPSYPGTGMLMGASEIRRLVKGGLDRKGRGFSYYAGQPKGAPKGTKAFVGLGRNGWQGWTASFLDPGRQYVPVEIWGGYIPDPGKPKSTFSSWKADGNGRLYAGEMVEEFIKPRETKVGYVYFVTTERFTRTVDPKSVESIAFPKGTTVMLEHDPDSRYVVGEEKH